MPHAFRLFFLVVTLALFPGDIRAAEAFTHLGPVETLDNGVVRLGVALRVGRVVSYRRGDEPDRLVVRDEAPLAWWPMNLWGGDRIWPTVQSLNPQIYGGTMCDPVIDGQPWELVRRTPTSLEMRSGVSPHLGLRVTRRIELAGGTTEVLHAWRLERVSASRFPVHVWAVTGVRAGDYVLMESDARASHGAGAPFKAFPSDDPKSPPPVAALLPGTRVLRVDWPAKDAAKAGTYGRWIAMVAGGSALLQTVEFPHGELFLDASNLQTYNDPVAGLHEIETLSPTWQLAPGETREWTVRWRLVDFPPSVATPSDKAAFLHAQAVGGTRAKGAAAP